MKRKIKWNKKENYGKIPIPQFLKEKENKMKMKVRLNVNYKQIRMKFIKMN